jgi:DNA-directed RNA polymerase specialized sigma subunit
MELHRDHVRRECRRLSVQSSNLDDHEQEGVMALRVPIHRFDPARGSLLWPYARFFVRRCVIECMGADMGLTRHQTSFYKPVRRAWDALTETHCYPEPSAVRSHLREHQGKRVSEESISAILGAIARRSVSLDDARDQRRA